MCVCTTKGEFNGSPARLLSYVFSVAVIRIRGNQCLEVKGKNSETVSVSAQLHTSVVSRTSVALLDKFVTLLVAFKENKSDIIRATRIYREG